MKYGDEVCMQTTMLFLHINRPVSKISFCLILSILTTWPTFQNHSLCNVKCAIPLVHHIAIIYIILVGILYFPQSVRMWNELPASLPCCHYISTFKRCLYVYLLL